MFPSIYCLFSHLATIDNKISEVFFFNCRKTPLLIWELIIIDSWDDGTGGSSLGNTDFLLQRLFHVSDGDCSRSVCTCRVQTGSNCDRAIIIARRWSE